MSVRIQVILDEKDAARIRARAREESKSMSAWLREAGLDRLEQSREKTRLDTPEALEQFFARCDKSMEPGAEPDWEEYKALIEDRFGGGAGR